ncbi:MAG TPA: hypothetical protein PKN17_01460, partial [Bacillota bacterium]|nr:hypothetical protein [Bacillota bacterium]
QRAMKSAPTFRPPDEPTELHETEPFIKTPEGWEIVKKAIVWGAVLLVSLTAMVAASIILLKKEKIEENKTEGPKK